jgi:hypothetical protein
MTIHEYFYNEDNKRLYIEFSTRKDGDRFYRILELDYDEVEFYSPEIISEEDLLDIEKSHIIDVILEYLKDNDLPSEIVL